MKLLEIAAKELRKELGNFKEDNMDALKELLFIPIALVKFLYRHIVAAVVVTFLLMLGGAVLSKETVIFALFLIVVIAYLIRDERERRN